MRTIIFAALLTLTGCASDGVDWNGMIRGMAEIDRYERANPEYIVFPSSPAPQRQCVPVYNSWGGYQGCN